LIARRNKRQYKLLHLPRGNHLLRVSGASSTWHIDYLFSTMHLCNFTCVIVLDICLHSSKKAKKLARDENMASTARADRLAEAKAAMFSPKIPAHR
jgi:Uri superfamily endonuclease